MSNLAFSPALPPDRGAARVSRRGILFVLSSPSGAGKTTIARRLLDLDPAITMSVSVTTRPKRPRERPGVDYHFIDHDEYARMVTADELLEHARVFDNFYGTPRRPVEAELAAGRDVLFDIDWQGTQQLVTRARDDLATIFILPPSAAELERRLRNRAEDPPEVIAGRMRKAAGEMSHYDEYDYVVVNRDLAASVEAVYAIVIAERQKRVRQTGLAEFVRDLQGAGSGGG